MPREGGREGVTEEGGRTVFAEESDTTPQSAIPHRPKILFAAEFQASRFIRCTCRGCRSPPAAPPAGRARTARDQHRTPEFLKAFSSQKCRVVGRSVCGVDRKGCSRSRWQECVLIMTHLKRKRSSTLKMGLETKGRKVAFEGGVTD